MRYANSRRVHGPLFVLCGVVLLASVLRVPAVDAQTIRRVPQDYATIQSAIDAAEEGDSVLVAPGTYRERINFLGKAITVESVDGREMTIIDGALGGTVVTINADPGETPVLRGFTVRNGYGSPGGVATYGGPALIEQNLITENFGCSGSGLEASFSKATVRANVISRNRNNCSGGFGGGISLRGAGTVQVLDNVIESNSNDSGGGIALFAAGTPAISGNLIRGNSGGREGGGISLGNQSDALIVNNVIVGNNAYWGGGISWGVPLGAPGPTVVNNTIAGNTGVEGSAIFADGFDANARLLNNVLVGSGPAAVVHCGTFNSNVPRITFNDVFNTAAGPTYGGDCSSQTGVNGNISDDPRFVNAAGGDFHLTPDSPAIDAGTNAGAPPKDIDGDPRPLDGNGDGAAVVDMGAYEAEGGVSHNHAPAADAGIAQTVECAMAGGSTVTLDGSSSSDPDGDALTFEWRDEAGQLVGDSAVVTLVVATGTHRFDLTVSDGELTSSDSVTVQVQDTIPPNISVDASPSVLGPPNHALRAVTSQIHVADLCDPAPAFWLEAAVSNEPDNGVGDGDTVNDIQGADLGTPDLEVLLRAERSARGNGRVYTLVYRARDAAGNSAQAATSVKVPR